MIFKSRQVNLDPEPWVNPKTGTRYPAEGGLLRDYLPRPEFEPTRDYSPWVWESIRHGHYAGRSGGPVPEHAAHVYRSVWAPRREQFDTPVNRVLKEFRECGGDPAAWLLWLDETSISQMGVDPTPEEVDHARRVLTRLANWKER